MHGYACKYCAHLQNEALVNIMFEDRGNFGGNNLIGSFLLYVLGFLTTSVYVLYRGSGNDTSTIPTYTRLKKNIKNVKRCRDGMPKSRQTR